MNFPKSTEFNKRIPKQKFYDNINVTPALKKSFVDQINTVYWKNKIAPSTINLGAGENVTEIEVFEINLNTKSLDENVLKQIDKEIPYHILFILKYEEKYQAWIGYKEKSNGNNAFKVTEYYHTEWIEDLQLEIQGLNMDSVYENFIRQIAGDKLSQDSDESIQESVEKAQQKETLQKQIDKLTKTMRKEKQFNKQMELNNQIKCLKKELEAL